MDLSKLAETTGLWESKHPAPIEDPKPVTQTIAPATPASSFTMPASGATFAPSFGNPVFTPEDETRFHQMEQQIYSVPSSYIPFREVRAVLGGTNDVTTIMRMVTAANPAITADKVKHDIQSHLDAIAKMRDQFQVQMKQAMDVKVNQPQQRIATLTQQIQSAQKEIADLQQAVTTDKQHLDEGTTKFNLMTDRLAQPLKEANQLLGVVS